ncbi:MAG: XdhC/CoxI family protein [Lachnospiraceae bacterium]|nr:XdhC/CoxI family protein [Lachnospiraceae bacterium]
MAAGVYEKLEELADSNESFILCRIIRSEGSTPRKTGALMAVKNDGTVIGSVGGGRPEYECIMKARQMMERAFGGNSCINETMHFDLYPDNDHACGGEMDVEITFFPEVEQCTLHEPGRRQIISEKHRRRKVYIFGGGHVAQALVPVLEKIEFAPIVYEERSEFAQKELFPDADRVICEGFSNIGESVSLVPEDYVAIMTRGHEDDYEVLKEVLSTNVEYIGLMGSRSKKKMLFEKLENDGFSDKDIERIHTPIGLDIGSETPEEIAISIAAELISIRAHSKEETAE